MAISCRLGKLDSERDNFGTKIFLHSKTSKRIIFFNTCQSLNRKCYKASSFETKIIFGSLKSVFKNSVSSVNLHHKKVEKGITVVFWKAKIWGKKDRKRNSFWIKFFEKIQILNHMFWNASDFDKRFLNVSVFEPTFQKSSNLELKI